MKSEVIAAIMTIGLLSAGTIPASAQPQLTEAARSESMIWNGVAVEGSRIFVSGPRWTGSKSPAVGVLDGNGRPIPYPDAAENAPSTMALANRSIVVDGKPVLAPDGTPLKVNADPMEVSPDGRWFYFGPLEGPWSRIEIRWPEDTAADPETVASKVEPWADLPPTSGTAMDANGDLYFSDLASNSLKRRAVDGTISTVIQDPGLHWIDAMAIDVEHRIWMPVPQMDRVAAFHDGRSEVQQPVALYRLSLPSLP